KDIDASSRHAELRPLGAGWVLVDLGSSNGTYVDGHRIAESAITPATPLMLEFGPGGPRVRLFVGDDAAIEGLPPAPMEAPPRRWILPVAAAAIVIAVTILLLARC